MCRSLAHLIADDAAFRKRQSADAARHRDETFVFHSFVAFCEPAYSSELSVSAYVLFRCLVEWDSFRVEEGRLFREQLQEGFEKLSKSVNGSSTPFFVVCRAHSLSHVPACLQISRAPFIGCRRWYL